MLVREQNIRYEIEVHRKGRSNFTGVTHTEITADSVASALQPILTMLRGSDIEEVTIHVGIARE